MIARQGPGSLQTSDRHANAVARSALPRHNRAVKRLKLISGGQSGADISIVEVARALDLPCGGMVPAGWMTEDGPRSDLETLGFTQAGSREYAVRTRQNVEQSDATLVFATDPDSDGTRLTIAHARRCGKPVRLLDPYESGTIEKAEAWLREIRPEILNIAGNRESRAPGIRRQVECILRVALSRYLAS